MTSDPWVKFYSSDWLAGTSGLTVAEKGVYITLCALMYEHDGPIALDEARLARRCGCPKATFQKILKSLLDEEKLTLTDGELFNARCGVEIGNRKNRSENGRALALKRWKAQEEKTQQKQGNGDASAMRSDMRTRTRTRVRKKEDNPLTPFDVLREVLDEGLAKDFVDHRKTMRKPLTARAARGVVNSLTAVVDAGRDPFQAIELAIERGWLTVKLEWLENSEIKFTNRNGGSSGFLSDALRDAQGSSESAEGGPGSGNGESYGCVGSVPSVAEGPGSGPLAAGGMAGWPSGLTGGGGEPGLFRVGAGGGLASTNCANSRTGEAAYRAPKAALN